MADYHYLLIAVMVFGSGAISAMLVRSTVVWKRPARCPNCARRPRWAFDFTPRGKAALLRDHLKECES